MEKEVGGRGGPRGEKKGLRAMGKTRIRRVREKGARRDARSAAGSFFFFTASTARVQNRGPPFASFRRFFKINFSRTKSRPAPHAPPAFSAPGGHTNDSVSQKISGFARLILRNTTPPAISPGRILYSAPKYSKFPACTKILGPGSRFFHNHPSPVTPRPRKLPPGPGAPPFRVGVVLCPLTPHRRLT